MEMFYNHVIIGEGEPLIAFLSLQTRTSNKRVSNLVFPLTSVSLSAKTNWYWFIVLELETKCQQSHIRRTVKYHDWGDKKFITGELSSKDFVNNINFITKHLKAV